MSNSQVSTQLLKKKGKYRALWWKVTVYTFLGFGSSNRVLGACLVRLLVVISYFHKLICSLHSAIRLSQGCSILTLFCKTSMTSGVSCIPCHFYFHLCHLTFLHIVIFAGTTSNYCLAVGRFSKCS